MEGESHKNDLCVWLLLRSRMFWEVVAGVSTHAFLWLSIAPLYRRATVCSSVHSLMDTWVVLASGLLCIVLMWTVVYWVFVRVLLSVLCDVYVRWCGHVVGSSASNCPRSYRVVFHSSCTVLHPPSDVRELPFPIAQPSLAILFLVCFAFDLIRIIPLDRKWYLIVVLICISSTTDNVEHILLRLLAVCSASLGKCPFKPLAHF